MTVIFTTRALLPLVASAALYVSACNALLGVSPPAHLADGGVAPVQNLDAGPGHTDPKDAGIVDAYAYITDAFTDIPDADILMAADAACNFRRISGLFQGATETSSAVTYGGGDYCNYSMTLSNITMSALLAEGTALSSTVTALQKEAVTAECSSDPMDPQTRTSTSLTSALSSDILTINYSNNPQYPVIFTARMSSCRKIIGTLTFERINQAPQLNWRLDVPMTLLPGSVDH